MIQQIEISITPKSRGFHLVTNEIMRQLPKLPKTGIVNIFTKHTSSLQAKRTSSFSISKAGATREREVDALNKIPKVLACDRRIILTYEESDTITDDFGTIEVMPLWKWILGFASDYR